MVAADRAARRRRNRAPAVLGEARAGRIVVRLGVLDPVHRGSGPASPPRGQRARRSGATLENPDAYARVPRRVLGTDGQIRPWTSARLRTRNAHDPSNEPGNDDRPER